MTTRTHHVNVWGRRSGRRLLALAATAALTAGLTQFPVSQPVAHADTAVSASASTFTLRGSGYGHGWGMSQYGAYGAAKKKQTWRQILTFYYPGTTQAKQSAGASIKVWITADRDKNLRVLPAAGLKVSDANGHSLTLPTGSGYRAWQVRRSGSGFKLTYLKASGAWGTKKTSLNNSTWTFANNAKVVRVWIPGPTTRELRGTVSLIKYGSGARTVNRLPMESYLRGVVPAEMPTSWLPDAVRAQSVAARSYAARLQAVAKASTGYDVCDTTSCQVYRGYASISGKRRTVYETEGGNAAIKATDRTILKYGKAIALTQFASSNGGASATGDFAYLKAKTDPYDGVIKSQAWTKKISAASIQRAWPSAGTVKKLQVTKRDGSGRWGGRVTTIKIIGSKKTVTVAGSTFASRFGLRSRLFTP